MDWTEHNTYVRTSTTQKDVHYDSTQFRCLSDFFAKHLFSFGALNYLEYYIYFVCNLVHSLKVQLEKIESLFAHFKVEHNKVFCSWSNVISFSKYNTLFGEHRWYSAYVDYFTYQIT